MRRLIVRFRLWWIEQDIATAEEIQNRLRKDLPALHGQRSDLLQQLWAIEQDQPI
jgi:hypothetical protein